MHPDDYAEDGSSRPRCTANALRCDRTLKQFAVVSRLVLRFHPVLKAPTEAKHAAERTSVKSALSEHHNGTATV
jgi:hypothetical protein